jgi:Phosphotransferase enzyme family
MSALDLPIRAAWETAHAFGIEPDRCDILQNGSTLVLRLTATLVARVVQDTEGPRQGTEWFARENAIAKHLTMHGAPVIPLHPDLPPGPHVHLGYPMNFWQFVTRTNAEPEPCEVGRTLRLCHNVLRTFPEPLPHLAILHESLTILEQRNLFPQATQQLLCSHLSAAIKALGDYPSQPLHGDAHWGNLMNTTQGLLWTDWEDTFTGPVEWDIASIIWNSQVLEEDHATVKAITHAYGEAGGVIDEIALQHCLIARAVVMTAWYPILYPNPNEERRAKLQQRLTWLKGLA